MEDTRDTGIPGDTRDTRIPARYSGTVATAVRSSNNTCNAVTVYIYYTLYIGTTSIYI
jgi:hypothetical protein